MLSAAEAGRAVRRLMKTNQVLHERVHTRIQHLNADPEVAPKLLAPLDGIKYQSDLPRQKWVDLKHRMTENPPVVHVTPVKTTNELQAAAEALESVWNAALPIVDERNGYRICDAMADEQITKAVGILHWRRASELWPPVPEAELLDEMPDDEEEAKRFREVPDDDEDETKRGKFEETGESLEERTKRGRAMAGFPYHWEAIHCTSAGWVPDMLSETAMVCITKLLYALDYEDELKATPPRGGKGKLRLLKDNADKLKLYLGKDVPRESDPSYNPPGSHHQVVVASLWTRDAWYELFADGPEPSEWATWDAEWQIAKSGKHEWGRPPFSLAYAIRYHHPDPAWQYQPALEGLFRLKPEYDKAMAVMHGLAERTALPEIYVVKGPNGEMMVDDDGFMVALSRDAMRTMAIPEGWEVKLLQFDLSEGFVHSMEVRQQEYQNSAPETGQAEVGASTQPWTVRLAQAQASVLPRAMISNQAYAIREMVRSITKDISRRGEPVAVFKRDGNGREDPRNIVEVKPESIESLHLDVDIGDITAAERITIEQHGLNLLEKQVITMREFLEDYKGDNQPLEKMAELLAEQIVQQYIGQLVAQEAGARWGTRVVLGSNGQFIGPGGQEMPPSAVLQANGQQPLPPPMQPNVQSQMQPNMAGLGDPQPPEGVMPQPELMGV